jgi:S-formylglutathione hydrolase FrmB
MRRHIGSGGQLMRVSRFVAVVWLFFVFCATNAAAEATSRFEITIPASAHSQPITGRIYVIITGHQRSSLLTEIGSWEQQTPFFGKDVSELQPGVPAVIDDGTLGYPLRSLNDIPAGDYFVQALVNVYTEFHRADGRVIWAHMDQWEGQQFNQSPGNFYSDVQKVHLDFARGYTMRLHAAHIIPSLQVPPDTEWIKHIKFQSHLLTQFWGRPIYIGATVLLPKSYAQYGDTYYPVIYEQGHFSLKPPLFMQMEPPEPGSKWGTFRYGTFKAWSGANFPRMIAVTFQHPTPYFDDSYAVNSANNGPYGDAILQELIPYIEEHFRIIRQPWARVLMGGSTGGWEALALQLYRPDFFGGAWVGFPDPIDFRHYQLVNIYGDLNAFEVPGHDWVAPERPLMRTVEGQVVETERQMSQLEDVLGSHGRSGQQLEAWEAVYGPVGEDGYPKPLWNKRTGEIDRTVADYMRDHGYDLRVYAENNWARIGPELTDKIFVWVGDMDNFYLNLAVYDMDSFLKMHADAHAHFKYGRPEKGHGWFPWQPAEFIQMLARHVADHAPSGTDTKTWHY